MKLQWLSMGAAMAGLASIGLAQNTVEVTMDGTPVYFSGHGAMMVGGQPMVPVRGVIESAGGTVVWDPISHTVAGQKDQTDFQLTIGSSTAKIDGANFHMEAPAMLYKGRTYVPASFVGEALNKNSQFLSTEHRVVFSNLVAEEPEVRVLPDASSETYVVRGPETTIVAEPTPTIVVEPQQTTETVIVRQDPVVIRTIMVDADPWLSPGDVVHITMDGTPGLNATARIAGFTDEVVLYERTPGHYVGTWVVPSGGDIYLPEARVTGYLRGVSADAQPFMLDWSDTIVVDTSMPAITSITPDDGDLIRSSPVRIHATLNDAGSGIDKRDVRLYVNGIDETNDAFISDGHLAWTARPEDVEKKMDVELLVRDRAGNETSRMWTFYTDKSDWGEMGNIYP